MQFKIKGEYGHDDQVNLRYFPEECPHCHRTIQPNFVYGRAASSTRLECVFQCPSSDCGRLFIAYYGAYGLESVPNANITIWRVQEVSFGLPKKPPMSDTIESISPEFIATYCEASEAEERKLYRIAGPGYRRALEFLIKDYLIRKLPTEEEKIRRTLLGPCIRDYVDEPTLKKIAERAAWLGNDEVHYARRWEGKTLSDLKRAIDLAVRWIELHEISERVIADMPDGGKRPS